METERGDILTMKNVGMRISGLIAGIILAVLGALVFAERVITLLGNPAFIFIENMNRGFELLVGLVTIMVAAATMGTSRA